MLGEAPLKDLDPVVRRLELRASALEVDDARLGFRASGLEVGPGRCHTRARFLGAPRGGRDAIGVLLVRGRELGGVPCFDLGKLRLELFAERADLLLQLGFALDELGSVRCPEALDLGLRRAQLIGQLGRPLLLVAERPHLAARVVELGAGAPQLGLHRVHRVARVE